jgi:hypothetical protein
MDQQQTLTLTSQQLATVTRIIAEVNEERRLKGKGLVGQSPVHTIYMSAASWGLLDLYVGYLPSSGSNEDTYRHFIIDPEGVVLFELNAHQRRVSDPLVTS